MPTLHLGVLDVGYSDASGSGAKTTGEVAEGLENGFPSKDGGKSEGYHIMQTFYDQNATKIAGWIAEAVAGSIETLVKSAHKDKAKHKVRGVTRTASGEMVGTFTFAADQQIETAFREFIFGGEMAKLKGASVTAVAPTGYSLRFEKPGGKRKPRPDFVSTGLYVASMRAWTTES